MKTEGQVDGYRRGSLKRRLPTVRLLRFDGSLTGSPSGTKNFRLNLRNLNNDLTFQIAVGIVDADGNPIRPSDGITTGGYPASPGVVQLVPITNYTDSPKIWLRPVFQDPTSTTNVNAPLPEEIPFGWNDNAETDEIEINVSVDVANYAASLVNGFLVVQAMVEYNGDWWDVDAIINSMGQVQLGPGSKTLEVIGTLGA